MAQIPYFLYDVFSLIPGGGGPLVVVDCRELKDGLSDEAMQKIAFDFDLPETTFIYKASNAKNIAKVRIFTPVMELPMAGHPTVGTSIHLYNTQSTPDDFVIELGVGDTQIEIEKTPQLQAFMYQQPCNAKSTQIDKLELAKALSIHLNEFGETPIEVFSAGLSFIIVPVTSKEVLYTIVPSRELITRSCTKVEIEEPRIYAFSRDHSSSSLFHARMFNPDPGDGLEDPATGSAAGSLTHYIDRYYPKVFEQHKSIKISQGVTMGRPSEITTSLAQNSAGKRVPRVGGSAIKTGEGNL